MKMTKEKYIEVGSEFTSENVLAQIEDSLTIAARDAALLARFGWPAKKTDKLKATGQTLTAAKKEYERKYGTHLGTTRGATVQIDLAKRWCLRAISIAWMP